MKPLTYHLSSDFELPSQPASCERHVGDITVETSAACTGHALKACLDISEALLHGAVPSAQVVMHERVQRANRDSLPLSCVLSFGS